MATVGFVHTNGGVTQADPAVDRLPSPAVVLATVARVHEAPLRSDAWTAILRTVAPLHGCDKSVFVSVDPTDSGNTISANIGFSPGAATIFKQRHRDFDDLCAATRRLPADSVFVGSELLGREAHQSSGGYRQMTAANGADYSIGAVLENQPHCVSTLTFFRSGRDFGSPARELLTLLLPHIQTAAEVGRRIQESDRDWAEVPRIFELTRQPAAIMDRGGRVLYVNPPASRIVERKDGINLQSGRFVFEEPALQDEFDRLVRTTANPPAITAARAGGAVRAPRQATGAFYELLVMPFHEAARRALRRTGAACMVLINDPLGSPKLYLERLTRLYDLTPAEGKVCEAVFATGAIQQAAELLNVTRNTVCSHLKGIYRKMGVSNQGQLMRRLTVSSRLASFGDDERSLWSPPPRE